MTDAEILDRLQKYFQNQINNLNATEMAEGPFDDGTEDGELWEQAASRIDARGGLRVRFEFGDGRPRYECCPDCGAVGYGNVSCLTCHREWRKTWHKPCAICRDDEPTEGGAR